jgi:predicted nucleic acid-binding protein
LIVLDASAAVDLFLRIEPNASRIGTRLGQANESLHAPMLLDAEILQVLRRYAVRGEISGSRAEQALTDLIDLRIARYPILPLLERMWTLRPNLTEFDAAYVALAEVLDAPLVTSDVKLARASGHRATVELCTG